ncbi:MAG TPA: dihydrofolate reductase [Kofleriaceae bacterium]|nr:dihydrofolate reductase [Kofleriaceae bacterium]
MFDIVVAADLDRGIGKDNGLPWPKLRGDLRHFKKTTSTASADKRNAIVMGRKTAPEPAQRRDQAQRARAPGPRAPARRRVVETRATEHARDLGRRTPQLATSRFKSPA